MDGFEPNNGVIVMAATNLEKGLDPALVRAGRFDRHVAVPLPDFRGRVEVLQHYLQVSTAADRSLGTCMCGMFADAWYLHTEEPRPKVRPCRDTDAKSGSLVADVGVAICGGLAQQPHMGALSVLWHHGP